MTLETETSWELVDVTSLKVCVLCGSGGLLKGSIRIIFKKKNLDCFFHDDPSRMHHVGSVTSE